MEPYLPLIERVRKWADRKKRVSFPLFPSYIFARIDLRLMPDVIRTPGIAAVVRTSAYPTPVGDEEIESVRILSRA